MSNHMSDKTTATSDPMIDPDYNNNRLQADHYKRGAIVRVTVRPHLAPDGRLYPSEPNMSRPYILMSPNPYERFLDGLKIHAVPTSNKLNYASERVVIQNFGTAVAVTDMATTLEPSSLGTRSGRLSIDEVNAVEQSLARQFAYVDFVRPQRTGRPGSIVDAPWDGEIKRFVIVGSAHITNPFSPVIVVPENERTQTGELTGENPQPLACARMRLGYYRGELSKIETERLQGAVLAGFGLS